MTKPKLCVIASGGDAPGMNACVESIHRTATAAGIPAFFATAGYDGLVNNNVAPLTPDIALHIAPAAGCVLKAGRSDAFRTPEGLEKAVRNIRKHKFTHIVILGGNGSFKGAARLAAAGVPVLCIPATIDNDVFFTKNSLGFSSACEKSTALVDGLKETMRTNDRDHIVQMMGWHCDQLTTTVGAATFAEILDTNANRHTPEQIAQIFAQNRRNGITSNMMLMQERLAPDRQTADIVAEGTAKYDFLSEVMAATGDEGIRINVLGHLQRGARPSCRDRWLGAHYGRLAVELAATNQSNLAIALLGDEFRAVALEQAL